MSQQVLSGDGLIFFVGNLSISHQSFLFYVEGNWRWILSSFSKPVPQVIWAATSMFDQHVCCGAKVFSQQPSSNKIIIEIIWFLPSRMQPMLVVQQTLHFAKLVPMLCASMKGCLGSSSFMLLAPMYDLGIQQHHIEMYDFSSNLGSLLTLCCSFEMYDFSSNLGSLRTLCCS